MPSDTSREAIEKAIDGLPDSMQFAKFYFHHRLEKEGPAIAIVEFYRLHEKTEKGKLMRKGKPLLNNQEIRIVEEAIREFDEKMPTRRRFVKMVPGASIASAGAIAEFGLGKKAGATLIVGGLVHSGYELLRKGDTRPEPNEMIAQLGKTLEQLITEYEKAANAGTDIAH